MKDTVDRFFDLMAALKKDKEKEKEAEKMAIIDPRRLFIDASTHNGKANLDPSLYSEDGMPIPRQDITATLDANGLPLKPLEMDTGLNDYSEIKMVERFGAGVLSTKGVAKAKPSIPKATVFRFPRIGKDMLEVVYTPECDEVIELLEEHLLALAQTGARADKIMMGKKQYRQYIAYRCYNDRHIELPKKVADADIIVLNQENYFDVLPDLDTMITNNL